MPMHNICKFVSPTENTNLLVSRFILETSPTVMEAAATLGEHRATLVTAGGEPGFRGPLRNRRRFDLRFFGGKLSGSPRSGISVYVRGFPRPPGR